MIPLLHNNNGKIARVDDSHPTLHAADQEFQLFHEQLPTATAGHVLLRSMRLL